MNMKSDRLLVAALSAYCAFSVPALADTFDLGNLSDQVVHQTDRLGVAREVTDHISFTLDSVPQGQSWTVVGLLTDQSVLGQTTLQHVDIELFQGVNQIDGTVSSEIRDSGDPLIRQPFSYGQLLGGTYDFRTSVMLLDLGQFNYRFQVRASLPIPAAAGLFLTGLGGLAAVGYRRHRCASRPSQGVVGKGTVA